MLQRRNLAMLQVQILNVDEHAVVVAVPDIAEETQVLLLLHPRPKLLLPWMIIRFQVL